MRRRKMRLISAKYFRRAACGFISTALQVLPAVGAPSATTIPDFSGIWRHGSLPWLVPPASGPGPVTNKSRRPDDGTSDYSLLVGDYTNPILQPWTAEVVKKKGEVSFA